MRIASLFALLAALFLTACNPGPSPYFDTVTILSAGDTTNGLPTFGLRSVLLRGNFGLVWVGTNPVAISSNRMVGWSAEGPSTPPERDARAAAGWITFFDPDRTYDLADVDDAMVARTLAWKRASPGRIEAVRITGAFATLRSAERGEETQLTGTMMGFFVPDYLRGLQRQDYRWWFIDDRRNILLQVRGFTLRAGRIEVDESDDIQVRLPPKPPAG